MAEEQTHWIIACQCGQKMKVPIDAAGKTYKCVKCGERIKISETSAPPAAPAPSPADAPKAREVIGQMLLDAGLITAAQLQEALEQQKKQGGKTFENLIRLGHLKKEALHDFLSRQAGVAAIDLKRVQIDRKLIESIPRELALECSLLPIDKLGKLLTVAMACPLDRDTIEKMEQLTGLKVKAVLCKLDDIVAAVKKYYPDPSAPVFSEETLSSLPKASAAPKLEVTEGINRLEDIPKSAAVLERFRALLDSPAKGLGELAAVIGEDPALAAGVLRQANHAAYGLPGQVDNIAMAVALLGREGIAGGMTAADAYPTAWMEEYRRRCVRCARIAEGLAQAVGQVNPGAAFTAGLLSGIGAFALTSVAKEGYAGLGEALDGPALNAHETKAFGLGHPEAGMMLAVRWGYPDALAQALRHYLEPEKAATEKTLPRLLHIAACLASLDEEAAGKHLEPLRPMLNELKLDVATAIQVARQHPSTA